MNGKERGNWATQFGFIAAAAGSAVGLGNIWKFPYITAVTVEQLLFWYI